jgi:hypothetical protein
MFTQTHGVFCGPISSVRTTCLRSNCPWFCTVDSWDRVTHPTYRMAPPPGATSIDFFAPGALIDVNPNARCVLRSDQRSANNMPSIKLPLVLHRRLLGPRHTPYLSHGSAARGNINRLFRTGRTDSCLPKRTVCSAVRLAQCERYPFDHIVLGFEPKSLRTAPHTLLIAWLRRLGQHRSTFSHRAH